MANTSMSQYNARRCMQSLRMDATSMGLIALDEIAKERARRSLLDFTTYTFSDYVKAAHNILIVEYIHKWISGKIGNLMIFAPPRHGKSELVSRRLPPYLLAKFPGCKVLTTSHKHTMAAKNSRAARSIINSYKYRDLFPDVFLEERKAVEEWQVSNGGSYVCAGVDAGIQGEGFHFGIVDDPIKGRKAAESKTVRDSIWDWYRSDFYSRREKGAKILLINTRWHEDDLSGRLLEQMKEDPKHADKWSVLSLPAISSGVKDDPLRRKKGEALWPGEFSKMELAKIKQTSGEYNWASMYQQTPVPAGGEKINREWFNIIDRAPEGLRWYRYWDLAVSEKQTADYVASIAMARDDFGNLYLRDMIRGQWSWPKTRKNMLNTCKIEDDYVEMIGIEEAGQQRGFIDDLFSDHNFSKYSIISHKPDASKLVRALPWISKAEAGKVFIVRGNWVNPFLEECQHFTGHEDKHDDQIDAVSGAYWMVSKAGNVGIRFI